MTVSRIPLSAPNVPDEPRRNHRCKRSVPGGLLGVVGLHTLVALPMPFGVPFQVDLSVDWRVLLVALLLAVGCFMAAIAAQPVFRPLGARDLGRSDDYRKEKMPGVNVDMLDGTPLLDIKPYVPDFDIRSDVRTGWYAERSKQSL